MGIYIVGGVKEGQMINPVCPVCYLSCCRYEIGRPKKMVKLPALRAGLAGHVPVKKDDYVCQNFKMSAISNSFLSI